MIHIGRAGSRLGSFSEFEVRKGLKSGQFFLTDLGWKEGMEAWEPLSQFSEFSAPPEPMPPLPEEEPAGGAAPEAPEPAGLPWERRHEIGPFQGFIQTARLVLFNPAEAFSRMTTGRNLTDPLLYNLIGGWFGAIALGIYLVIMSRTEPANPSAAQSIFTITPAIAMRQLKLFIFMGPVLVTVTTALFAAIAHLLLMLCGGANKPLYVTLRVFCFSYGSAQLLEIIPVPYGNLLATIWMMVCCVVGLAVAHRTGVVRSVVTMTLFMLACFVFFACAAGALVMAAGGDAQSLQSVLSQ